MMFDRRQIPAGVAGLLVSARLPAQRLATFYAPVATGEDRGPPIARGRATTRTLFKAPPGYPNALGIAPDGFWVAEQRFDGAAERLHLLDWHGRLRRTILTAARDTSGVAFGAGQLWVLADDVQDPGVFEYDLDGRLLSHRQIPLGPATHAGGGHGATWYRNALWITANRPRAILRVDPATWTVDYLIPFGLPDGLTRYHGCAAIGESMYMISGTESRNYREGGNRLVRYDIGTGAISTIYDFVPGSSDPHGLMAHDGKLYGCDSGFHPGWSIGYDVPGEGRRTSPTAGSIFEIALSR